MHRRTLSRHLKSSGLGYRAITNEIRFEIARQLLQDTEVSLAQIAAALVGPVADRLACEGHLRQRPDRCDTARNWEAVMPTLAQVVVWVIVGLIGGSLAGLLVTWRRRGFGFVRNLGMGLIGALLGGLLFRVFGLFPGLDLILISLRDILAACAGSLLILVALWIWERSRRGP